MLLKIVFLNEQYSVSRLLIFIEISYYFILLQIIITIYYVSILHICQLIIILIQFNIIQLNLLNHYISSIITAKCPGTAIMHEVYMKRTVNSQ